MPQVKITPILIDTREGGKVDLKCEAGKNLAKNKYFLLYQIKTET